VFKKINYAKIWIKSNLISIFESFMFSIILIFITSSFRVINPKNVDWLSFGDGTAEISWEFFRKQPLFQFPLGLNPRYGLEVSSTAAFDGQIPIMSFIFHPIESLLPERFQYYGLFILLTFALNYYFAKKIFLFLGLTKYQSVLCGVILASSPVILNRFIENTHYSLTAAWLIFASMLRSLQRDIKLSKWIFIFIFTILIHLYFLPFILIIYILTIIYEIINRNIKGNAIITLLIILLASIITMYVTGYFYGGISGKDVGYGLFRSTLISMLDPSGWSRVIPDLPEPDGAYEGFAYTGIATIVLIFVYLLLFKVPKGKNSYVNFTPLWISASILFIFALSNKISFGTKELFEFYVPNIFSIITNTFRSSGRFTWLLVFLLFVYLVYSISRKISVRRLSLLLTFILLLNFFDSYQHLVSQRSLKFESKFNSSLTHTAWKSISQCYKNLRVYPPTIQVENYYAFLNIAYNQNLGINTGRFSRVNQNIILGAYDLMHREFNTGVYRDDSFYVFTNAEFVLPEIVNYQKNLAIHTLDDNSAFGELNGYTFIAPKLKNCSEGDRLKKVSLGFGAPESQRYSGEKLTFGKNFDTSKYILIGFSTLEDWGVWSVDEYSKINLNTVNVSNFESIEITARDLALPSNIFTVRLNESVLGTCTFDIEFTTCTLPFDFQNLDTNILSLSFSPKIIRNPKELGISEDTRNLGFGLKSISLN
jgi:hypothetical protein